MLTVVIAANLAFARHAMAFSGAHMEKLVNKVSMASSASPASLPYGPPVAPADRIPIRNLPVSNSALELANMRGEVLKLEETSHRMKAELEGLRSQIEIIEEPQLRVIPIKVQKWKQGRKTVYGFGCLGFGIAVVFCFLLRALVFGCPGFGILPKFCSDENCRASVRRSAATALPTSSPKGAPRTAGVVMGEDESAEAPSITPLLHRPLPQIVLCACGYFVHTVFLWREVNIGSIRFGLDTLVGGGVLAAAVVRRLRQQKPALPPWLISAACEDASACADLSDATKEERFRLFGTIGMLLVAPALVPLVLVVLLSLTGLPLSVHAVHATCLLTGLCGLQVVRSRHPKVMLQKLVRWSWRGPWLAPVLGGYAASVALEDLTRPLNLALLLGFHYKPNIPAAFPLLVFIEDCVYAPLFEELQCRAFILQALTVAMPLSIALLVQGVLFAALHLDIGGMIPRTVLGYFWGVMYVNSRNLLVPILIHALCNCRPIMADMLACAIRNLAVS